MATLSKHVAALAAVLLLLCGTASARTLKQATACPPEVEAALKTAEQDGGDLIVWGSTQNYSGGVVRTYTKFDAADPCGSGPTAVGVEISDATLEQLPGPDEVAIQPPAECKNNPTGTTCHPPFEALFLNWGDLGDWAPYQTMELDWNPAGHPLPGVYTTPHFDFHFYMQEESAIKAIAPGLCGGVAPEIYTIANEPIPESCFPGDNYTNFAAVAPFMGNHMISMNAPEIMAMMMGMNAIGSWNQTFIWGTYNGSVTFMEPMIKRSYLMDHPDECWPVPGMPEAFAEGGYKPSTYCVTSTDDAVRVEMQDFKMFEGGCPDSAMAPMSYAFFPPGSPLPSAECEYAKM